MNRITDVRGAAIAVENLLMFQKLCGEVTLTNVVLCTTFWDAVYQTTGERCEKELRDDFWKPMIDAGSVISRHYGTRKSAFNVVKLILPGVEEYPLQHYASKARQLFAKP